jgi:hypothetical protein
MKGYSWIRFDKFLTQNFPEPRTGHEKTESQARDGSTLIGKKIHLGRQV